MGPYPRLSVGTDKGLVIVDTLTNKFVKGIGSEEELISEQFKTSVTSL